jgi:hypothetical protein
VANSHRCAEATPPLERNWAVPASFPATIWVGNLFTYNQEIAFT